MSADGLQRDGVTANVVITITLANYNRRTLSTDTSRDYSVCSACAYHTIIKGDTAEGTPSPAGAVLKPVERVELAV
jgi:hypothetical protein